MIMINEKEIVTALEVCVSDDLTCEECPYFLRCSMNDRAYIQEDMLELLKQKNKVIDKYFEYMSERIDDLVYQCNRARAEAITEFQDELKAHLCSYDLDNYHSFKAVEEDVIDQIAEKLKEGINK